MSDEPEPIVFTSGSGVADIDAITILDRNGNIIRSDARCDVCGGPLDAIIVRVYPGPHWLCRACASEMEERG